MSPGIQSQVARPIDEGKYHIAYYGARLAIQKGSFRYFKIFSRHVNNIDTRLEEGKTLLHFAAQVGDALSVQALIQRGSNMHQQDENGVTPFELAREHLVLQSFMLIEKRYGHLFKI